MAIRMEQDLESAFILMFFRGYGNVDTHDQIIDGLGPYLVSCSGLRLPELRAESKDATYM